jgi:transcriptional regulator with XRE-family HTH domain
MMLMLVDRMKKRRDKLGFSQESLGKKIGITGKTIWRIENGERKVKEDTLLEIASALDTSVAYLIGETDDPSPPIRVQRKGERYTESGTQFNATANNHSTAIAGSGNNIVASQPEQSESAFPEVKTNATPEGEGIIFEFEPGKRLMFPKGTPQEVIDATVAAVLRCYA